MTRILAFMTSGIALILPITGFAQSSSNPFQFGSRKMSRICSSQQNLSAIGADSLGYTKSRTARDDQTEMTDNFALASVPRLSYQITDARWQREVDGEGRCLLSLILLIPPDLTGPLGGVSSLSGNVELRLREVGGKWSLANEFGDAGIPKNDFRDHFRPLVYSEVRRKITEAKRQESNRQRADISARRQAEAEAEAAYKRDFPREWAAEQERQRVQKERRRQVIKEQLADEQRKAEACEANGGTWGYKTNQHGMKVSQTGCFFRISE